MSLIRRTEWVIYTCRKCGQIRGEDPCDRCGDDGMSVMTGVVHGDKLTGAVDALERIVELGRTDGPAAPLLVQAGDVAAAALRGMRGQ